MTNRIINLKNTAMNVLEKIEAYSLKASEIEKDLYVKHDVKRGLRNQDGP